MNPYDRAPRRSATLRCWSVAALTALAGCTGCVEATTTPPVGRDARIVWSVDLPAAGDGVPVMLGDRVVVAGDSGIAAYSTADGTVVWRSRIRVRGSNRSFVVDGDVLFAAGVGAARAFDTRTGALLWERPMPQESSLDAADPVADARAVYVGTRDLRVLALSRETGEPLWDSAVPRNGWHESTRQIVAGLALSGDTVYAAVNRDLTPGKYESAVVVVAFDRNTGHELWRAQTSGTVTGTSAAPVLFGRLLIIGGARDGHSVAIDRFTGQEVWKQDLYGYVWSTPPLRDGRVYFGTQAGRLYAVDAASGRSIWETGLKGGSTYQEVCGDKLVVENTAVELFDRATGAPVGTKIQLAPHDFVSSGIAVSGNRAFFAGQQKLYAIRCD
jgi:outer membrane protein assembly factor BamB